MSIPHHPRYPANLLSSAQTYVPITCIGPLANAMPESLGAALDSFMSQPETSSYRFSTEDLAEVLLVCVPIASAASAGLKCRRIW